jgi:hypothetical protein
MAVAGAAGTFGGDAPVLGGGGFRKVPAFTAPDVVRRCASSARSPLGAPTVGGDVARDGFRVVGGEITIFALGGPGRPGGDAERPREMSPGTTGGAPRGGGGADLAAAPSASGSNTLPSSRSGLRKSTTPWSAIHGDRRSLPKKRVIPGIRSSATLRV